MTLVHLDTELTEFTQSIGHPTDTAWVVVAYVTFHKDIPFVKTNNSNNPTLTSICEVNAGIARNHRKTLSLDNIFRRSLPSHLKSKFNVLPTSTSLSAPKNGVETKSS
jgi:hypothetical protein